MIFDEFRNFQRYGAVAPEADVAAVQVVLRNPGIAVVDVTEFCFSKGNLSPWTIAA